MEQLENEELSFGDQIILKAVAKIEAKTNFWQSVASAVNGIAEEGDEVNEQDVSFAYDEIRRLPGSHQFGTFETKVILQAVTKVVAKTTFWQKMAEAINALVDEEDEMTEEEIMAAYDRIRGRA